MAARVQKSNKQNRDEHNPKQNTKAKHYNKIQFAIEIKRIERGKKRFYMIIINISKYIVL